MNTIHKIRNTNYFKKFDNELNKYNDSDNCSPKDRWTAALKRGGTIEEMVLKYLRDSSKHPDDHVNKGHNKNSKK